MKVLLIVFLSISLTLAHQDENNGNKRNEEENDDYRFLDIKKDQKDHMHTDANNGKNSNEEENNDYRFLDIKKDQKNHGQSVEKQKEETMLEEEKGLIKEFLNEHGLLNDHTDNNKVKGVLDEILDEDVIDQGERINVKKSRVRCGLNCYTRRSSRRRFWWKK